MHLRQATVADFEALANCKAQAYEQDKLTHYLSPYRHDFWQDYVQFIRQDQEESFFKPGTLVMVAELEDVIGSNTIIGAAFWERLGSSEAAQSWRRTTPSGAFIMDDSLNLQSLLLQHYIN